MQQVSENWKNAHKRTMLRESFVEVTLDITDPDARANASSQDNGAIYISDSEAVTEGVEYTPTPYCTLEQNMWCLDGKREAIPASNYGNNGYVSDAMSDSNCIFSAKLPLITINFGNETFTKLIPGVTITWSKTYGEFADTFTVVAYNGDTIVAEKEVTGNRSVNTMVFVDIQNYDSIEVIVKKWCLPNHRARVEEIFVGARKVYDKSSLFDYSHSQSVDPISTALPKSEIKFSISNVGGEYNPQNKGGLAKYLMERQEVQARYGMKMDDGSIEWINGGTFYLSEWYAKQNGLTADFTARDLLEFMSSTYYDDITEITERTLYDLAEKVLTSANLPLNSDGSVKWVIDESLRQIKTTAPLPEDTLANCLQLIANAGCCVIYQDRTGKLNIKPLALELKDYKINSFNSYTKSEITLSKPIKFISVKVYTYTIGGGEMKSTTSDYVEQIGTSGETITLDNPLITSNDIASDVLETVKENLNNRMTLDSSWRADVRLDALDFVTNENEFNSNRVVMTEVEYKYNGAFRARGKGKVIGDG